MNLLFSIILKTTFNTNNTKQFFKLSIAFPYILHNFDNLFNHHILAIFFSIPINLTILLIVYNLTIPSQIPINPTIFFIVHNPAIPSLIPINLIVLLIVHNLVIPSQMPINLKSFILSTI